MKRKRTCILLLLLSLVAAGCSRQTQETTGYLIYCVNEAGTRLETESYTPTASDTDGLVEELIAKLGETPSVFGHQKAIPDGIGVTSVQRTEQNLKLDFNGTYSEMDHITEVFCRAAVVQTLVQIPEIETVEFTVNGQELADTQGNPLGVMGADSFIDTKGEGINSYQFGALTLYFADETGEHLVKEMRNVHYSSNTSLERVVLDELLKGPVNEKLTPVFPAEARILDVTVQEEQCIVDLDTSCGQQSETVTALPEITLYAIVNAICENSKITSVQFQINGSSAESFGGEVDISKPFTAREDLLQISEETETKQTELRTPSVGVDPSLK